MAVKIRMKKFGRKNRPEFRIVAADTRSPRDGSIIEKLGFYHPLEKDAAKVLQFDQERVKYWLSVGAQPSETITSILKKHGIAIPWVVNETAKTAKANAERRAKKGKPARVKKPAAPKPAPAPKVAAVAAPAPAAAPAAAEAPAAAPAPANAAAKVPSEVTEAKANAAASKAAKREAKKAGK